MENRNHIIYVITLVVLLLAGCTKDPVTVSPQSDYIVFGQQHSTRGLPVESGHAIHDGTAFGIYAYHRESSSSTVTGGYMDNQEVTRSGNAYQYQPQKLWPVEVDDELNFFAYYPYTGADQQNGLTVTYGSPAEPSMTLGYEMDTDPSRHVDLMYASTGYMGRQTPVSLDFRHALTRVTFAARTSGYEPGVVTITEVSIRDVVTRGELVVTEQTGTQPVTDPVWVLDGESKGDLVMDASNGLNPDMLLGNEQFQSILRADGTGEWMVLPQNIGNLVFEVKFLVEGTDETYTQDFLLIGTENWGMGDWINYNMDFGPDGVRLTVNVQYWDSGSTNISYQTNRVNIRDINGKTITHLVWVKEDEPVHRQVQRVYISADPQQYLKVVSTSIMTYHQAAFPFSYTSDDPTEIGLVHMVRELVLDIRPEETYGDRDYLYGSAITYGLYLADGTTRVTYSSGGSSNTISATLNLVLMRHFLEPRDLLPGYGMGVTKNVNLNFQVYGRWNVKSITEYPADGVSPLLDYDTGGTLYVGRTGGSEGSYQSFMWSFRPAATTAGGGRVEVVVESLDGYSERVITLNMLENPEVPSPHTGWAGSNIYWDEVNNRLTFDDVGITTHQKYQGVYFKWGGLVGMSPKTIDYTPGRPLYIPVEYRMPSDLWNVIPSVDFNVEYDETELMNYNYLGSVLDPTRGVGDICAYLSGKPGIPAGDWRLPTGAEFDAETYRLATPFVSYTSDNDYGKSEVPNGYYIGQGGPYLPASLSLLNSGVTSSNSYYWSSSLVLSPYYTYGTALRLQYGGVNIANLYGESAASVRCVRR